MQPTIEIENGVPRHPLYRMKEPVNFRMERDEHIALVGPNGGGKSLLVDILIGRWPLLMNEVKYDFTPSVSSLVCDNIKYITFRDSYGDADGSYYYQQRWNSQDAETVPLVCELLPKTPESEWKKNLFDLLGVEDMMDKYIVSLSSGELRRFQLVKALLSQPRVLILDNPFVGLDAFTRELLRALLEKMIQTMSLQMILVLSRMDEIPSFITHIVPVEGLVCGEKKLYSKHHVIQDEEKVLKTISWTRPDFSDEVIRLNKVTVRYGERIILKDIDWTVHRGERWALTGSNGSGKSTLLSLICADNPQSYACDISLFGHKRGTGESIWDIKKHIGYVSPEMHRAYLKNLLAIDVVASGLHDSVGLYVRSKPEQRNVCKMWMEMFGIERLKDRSFLQLSSGEQRLVLLARAFVKDPDLLILDEPLHGLDTCNRLLVKNIIHSFVEREGKTLIMVSHYMEDFPECMTHLLHLKNN